jgi:hypothetical protein
MQRLPTQSTCHHIRLSWMITLLKIIILKKFQPPFLPPIQLLLVKQILQTLMISEHFKLRQYN